MDHLENGASGPLYGWITPVHPILATLAPS
jgi:hypothetical protein